MELEHRKICICRPISGVCTCCCTAQKSCDQESYSPPLQDLGVKPTALNRQLHSMISKRGPA